MSEQWDFHDSSMYDQYFEASARKSPSLKKLEISMKLIGEGIKEEKTESEINLCATKNSSKDDPEKEEEPEEKEEWLEPDDSTISTQPEVEETPVEEEVKTEFSLSLWSAHETSETKTVESWNIPQGSVAWDDNDKPFEKLLQYAELELTEEEENGLLTDRIVAACCSYLTQTPASKDYVVAKVVLNNKNLSNIKILSYHQFLQYVDLSWNNLTDLTPLGCIPYLMYLDVSHNLLKEVLRFKPPWNLTYVNYSFNEVWQIDDLSDFWALCYLDLSHNKISKIQGLENLRYLRHLDLSHNKIEKFENLNHLRITDLNLEFNLISEFKIDDKIGLHTLMDLNNLYLNNNVITKLACFQNVYHLKKLELQFNNITEIVELRNLQSLKSLRLLDLTNNPVTDFKTYRYTILSILPNLKFLDQTEIDVAEKVAACKVSKPCSLKLEAARNNARMILLDQFNDPTMDLDVLPIDQGAYPLVILVGPPGSGKKRIIQSISEKYDQVHVGKLHTTKPINEDEEFVFINVSREEFHDKIKTGKFLIVMELLGHLYGFSREELGMAVKLHKACLTYMDMEGGLTIHSYGIQPFLILTMLKSEKDYLSHLKRKFGAVDSFLGAAYIAERKVQFESSKSVIEYVLNYMLEEVLELAEGRKDISSSTSCTEYLGAIKIPKEKPSSTYLSTSFGKSEMCDNTNDNHSDDTSYSEMTPGPMKMRYPDASYGEFDMFNDWSLPFVDHDEVNVDESDLREAAAKLCEKFIDNVMASREVYENIHTENPGLFSLVVHTDDLKAAIGKTEAFLKEIWCSTPDRKPMFDLEGDCGYKELIPKRLNKFKEIIKHNRYSPDGDNLMRNDSDITNPTRSIISQMQFMGYGDSNEKLE